VPDTTRMRERFWFIRQERLRVLKGEGKNRGRQKRRFLPDHRKKKISLRPDHPKKRAGKALLLRVEGEEVFRGGPQLNN